MTTTARFRHGTVFLVILTGLLAVQPISTDFYLPTLPSLTRAFGADTATVTWTLSALVGSFGLTQLFVGPLADRYGRKPVVLCGFALYCAASLLAMAAPAIEALIACRAVQGIGVACGFVVGRALIRDLFTPDEGARVMAHGFTWMSLVPLFGPFIGGTLDARIGWQAAFAVLAAYSGAMFALCALRLPETLAQPNPQATRLAPLLRNYAAIARHPAFAAFTAATACSYAGLFAFISGSSFVFIQIFGLGRQAYGLAFGGIVLGYLLGTMLCRRLVPRLGLQRTLAAGGAVSLASGAAMALLVLAGVWHPLALLLPHFGFMVAHGIVQPTGQTGCIAPFAQMAGAAAALNGFAQMMVAVAVGGWIGASFDHTPRPLALTIFAASCGVGLASLWLVPRARAGARA
jgi:DHA1 family bicyclomycin/chloramphenicol resistance-like MFS transporter